MSMLQLHGTANHVNFRIIESGLQAIASCADKARRQNWVCELYDVLNGNFCSPTSQTDWMQKFLNYFNFFSSVKRNNSQFKVEASTLGKGLFCVHSSCLLTGPRSWSRRFSSFDWWCFKWICALIDLFAGPSSSNISGPSVARTFLHNFSRCKSLFVNFLTSQKNMHDLFSSINVKTVFFDLNRTISLQQESRQWISIIVTGKKVHYSRNISQPILMDPFFKVKRRIFFPRCRFLKLFKIHSNFSRFCTVFSSCSYLQLAEPFLHVKDEKTSFPFRATVIFPAKSNLRNM